MSTEIDKAIASADLNAFGWQMGNYSHSTPFTSHIFYVRDFHNDQVHLFTIGQQDFDSARINLDRPISVYVDVVARLIKKNSGNKEVPQKDAAQLCNGLVGYIKNTGAYRLWTGLASADERMHAVINLYRLRDGSAMLRPFIIRHDELMLTPADVSGYTSHVSSIDRARHPEWFK